MITRRQLLSAASAAALVGVAPLGAVWAQGKKGPGGGPEGGGFGAFKGKGAGGDASAASGPPIIDCHSHMRGDWNAAIDVALRFMNTINVRRTVIMPPPQGVHNPLYDVDELSPVKRQKDRFSMVAGGGSLNIMLHRAGFADSVADDTMRRFERAATEILEAGAVAFGELTFEHFSMTSNHPHVVARPDGPLMLRLSDIAAERGVPIDIHMEAVPLAEPMPAAILKLSSDNATKIAANMERFEKLLAHNRKAPIVWVHLGWDNTGHRTPELVHALLLRHENLHLQIRPLPPPPETAIHSALYNFIVDSELRAEPRWVKVMSAFPERFTIGMDNFYEAQNPRARVRVPPPLPFARSFVNSLPPELAAKVAHENAVRLYKLPAV